MKITISELVDLVKQESTPSPSCEPMAINLGLRVFILQRGWAIVGRGSQIGCNITIEDGSVIRRWGTSRGLGQLAKEGPQTETKLDPVDTTHVHELGVVASIDCCDSSWSK